jgi:ABC-2 type transport system ATP-binding protein
MSEAGPAAPEAPRTMIDARGLSKYYGPFVAIEDLTFGIPEGQIAAFLGPNGAGKSTTMRILTGYLAASRGDASIAGLDVRTHRLEASRSLGYLPENGPLYPEMTPHELLRFFGEARELGAARLSERIEAVTDLCALQLVLILDEPTAGLDPNQIHEFRTNLQELRRQKKKTILLSTHILQEVDALADRILFVSNGRMVYDATIEEARRGGESLEALFHRLTAEAPGRPEPTTPSPSSEVQS